MTGSEDRAADDERAEDTGTGQHHPAADDTGPPPEDADPAADDLGEDDDGDSEADDGADDHVASKAEDDGDSWAEHDDADPLVPALEPAPFVELMAAYRQPATEGAERLPWSWATLTPAERAASAAVLDGFVRSYNRVWAISDEQTVPPCWHRHPALAHDLATLAWAYYQAYRDPTATPDLALRFQDHLPRFADRVDRWLGADPAACRAGSHRASWPSERPLAARGTSTDDDDAVLLLGEETFGFRP